MKKLLSLTLAIVLVLSLAVPAFAADLIGNKDNEQKSSGKTPVTVTYDENSTNPDDLALKGYTLVIPAAITPAFNQTSTEFEVSLSKANFTTSEQVVVTLTAGTLTLKEEGVTADNTIDFTVMNTTMNLPNTTAVKNNLNISTDEWATAMLGDYEGELTFSAVLADIE